MIVDKLFAVLRKDVLTAVRYRNGFVLKFLSSAAQLAGSYYLARSVGSDFRPDGMPYFVFLVIGAGFYTFLIAGAHSLLRVIQESQQNGTLEILMTTSTRPSVLVGLSAFSAFGGGALEFVFYLMAGAWITASGLRINYFGFASVFILSALIAAAIGLIAAALQIALHKGSTALWLFGSGAWLLTGTMFPVHVLPPPLRILSTLVPFTHSLAAMRQVLYPVQPGIFPAREIAMLFSFAALMLPASIVLFSLTVRRARQLGTLSFY
jgi:ABC-2 type transport system permease protein